MNSILKNPTHVAQIGYNGFNMEQIVDFTAAPCQLVPVYYDLLNPGDKVTCQGKVKLRTQPLDAAAEFSATVRLDWFAVPIEQLYKFFGQMYYGIQDIGTNFVNPIAASFTPSTNFPYFDVGAYWDYVKDQLSQATSDPGLGLYNYMPYEVTPLALFASSRPQMTVYINDMLRLMDHLGYPVDSYLRNKGLYGSGKFGSSFPVTALAYQKIFYDYYRQTDFQNNDPYAYNVDKCIERSNNVLSNVTLFQNIFKLHYIQWSKDFFHNVFSSPLAGSQSKGMLGVDVGLVNQWLTSLSGFNTAIPGNSAAWPKGGFAVDDNDKPTTVKISHSSSAGASNYATSGIINPPNINAMFAVQKALEITRRSGKHYDAQTLAHWGVSVPDSLANEVIYLGSQNQPLVVGDVVSTSASGNEPLGTIAGKGYSGPGLDGSYMQPIKFEAKSHSVLMCIFCVHPDLRYSQEGIEKLNNLVSPADWIHPEYDNLGMQPLFESQLAITGDADNLSKVVAWQYSYSELKCKYNRVFGNVHKDAGLNTWVPQFSYTDYSDSSIWYWISNPAYLFYGQPDWLNDSLSYKFMYNYLGLSSSSGITDNAYLKLYERDPFIVSAIFDCKKASKMSTYGLQTL